MLARRIVQTLRPTSFDTDGRDGLWLDADYALPGEQWCYEQFPKERAALDKCLALARDAGLHGRFSPVGQWYRPPGGDCRQRAAAAGVKPDDAHSCGRWNLGTVAEEWVWSMLGGRMVTGILDAEARRGGPMPPGQLPAEAFQAFSERVGYGVAGWHGGQGREDDLEWPFASRHPIRTLSAGIHDGETQNGRYSFGETDTLHAGDAFVGNTWAHGRQEYAGAAENHFPGPSPLYGTSLFGYVLWDRLATQPAGSFFRHAHAGSSGRVRRVALAVAEQLLSL